MIANISYDWKIFLNYRLWFKNIFESNDCKHFLKTIVLGNVCKHFLWLKNFLNHRLWSRKFGQTWLQSFWFNFFWIIAYNSIKKLNQMFGNPMIEKILWIIEIANISYNDWKIFLNYIAIIRKYSSIIIGNVSNFNNSQNFFNHWDSKHLIQLFNEL